MEPTKPITTMTDTELALEINVLDQERKQRAMLLKAVTADHKAACRTLEQAWNERYEREKASKRMLADYDMTVNVVAVQS